MLLNKYKKKYISKLICVAWPTYGPHQLGEDLFFRENPISQFPRSSQWQHRSEEKRGISLHPSEFGLIHRRISRSGEPAKLLFLPSWNELNCFHFCHQYTQSGRRRSSFLPKKSKQRKMFSNQRKKKFNEKKKKPSGAQLVLADEIMEKLH